MSHSNLFKTTDWEKIKSDLNARGYAIVKDVLSESDCQKFIGMFNDEVLYRKTIKMERHRFGKGTYHYFKHPLPNKISRLRGKIYSELMPLANEWSRQLNLNIDYPDTYIEFQEKCRDNNQKLATPLILKYGVGGFNTLHQDMYGEVYFPFQAVVVLNAFGKDYEGGEFVLTQQNYRAQSKAMVIQPKMGDMVVFASNFRPVKGVKGHYKTILKHGISEVKKGERYALGIILHDAIK